MRRAKIEVPKDKIAEFCCKHHIRKLEEKLSGLLGGYRVDLITEKFLNRRIRDRVLATAEVQYAQRG